MYTPSPKAKRAFLHISTTANLHTIQYNNTLLILKKEIQLSAFDK